MFETLLFPIDQSREALATASKAIELAQSQGSRMIILSVAQPEKTEMNNHESITKLLDLARTKTEQAGVSCEVIEREGKPAFVICDVADELNVDVIVMGTRGINLDENNESTAARVIQLAPCPVLVVP